MKIEYVEEDDSDDEESEEEEETSDEDEESLEDYKELIKEKTDRELIENIALRMLLLEKNVKQIQDDLVDTYNLIIEGASEDDEGN